MYSSGLVRDSSFLLYSFFNFYTSRSDNLSFVNLQNDSQKDNRKALYIKILMGIIVLVVIFVRNENLPKDDPLLARYANENVKEKGGPGSSDNKGKIHITGIVSDDPDIKNATAKFVLDVTSIGGINITAQKQQSKLLVKIDTPEIAYGDEIEIFTKPEKPKEIVNPDGRTFDYAAYLSKDGIFYTANVRSESAGGAKSLAKLLDTKKLKAESNAIYTLDKCMFKFI